MEQDIVEGKSGEKLSGIAIERFDDTIDANQIVEVEMSHGLDGFEPSHTSPCTPAKSAAGFEDLGTGGPPDPLLQQSIHASENRIEASGQSFECIGHRRRIVDCMNGRRP